jgi:hypothetical protein
VSFWGFLNIELSPFWHSPLQILTSLSPSASNSIFLVCWDLWEEDDEVEIGAKRVIKPKCESPERKRSRIVWLRFQTA